MPSKQALKAVIFDCDGTLVNSEPLHAVAIEQVTLSLGIKPDSFHAFHAQFSGKSLKCVYDILKKEFNITITCAEFLEKTLQASREIFTQRLSTVPYAHDMFAKLTLPRTVASNGIRESVLDSLTITNLMQYLPAGEDAIVTACQVQQPKPHPQIYQIAAERLSIHPTHCLAVEDSVTGVTAAKAAGMVVIGYSGVAMHANLGENLKAAGADYIIDDIRDILTYLPA